MQSSDCRLKIQNYSLSLQKDLRTKTLLKVITMFDMFLEEGYLWTTIKM